MTSQYNIITDELPNHFAYYSVDTTKTSCRFIMMPSVTNGADLSKQKKLYAIAVYYIEGDISFKRLPELTTLSTADVNALIIQTKPKPMQVQKILDASTDTLVKTKAEISSTVDYSIPSVSKLIKSTKIRDTASYALNPMFKNKIGLGVDQLLSTLDVDIEAFAAPSKNDTDDIFITSGSTTSGGLVQLEVFDKYDNNVQVRVTSDGEIVANNVIMTSNATPFSLALTLTDGTLTKTVVNAVYQRDPDGFLPTGFFDTFGNTIISIDGTSAKVKRTYIPFLRNKRGYICLMDVKKHKSSNKRILDVVANI